MRSIKLKMHAEDWIDYSEEVLEALGEEKPVVVLESTISGNSTFR